MKKSLLILGLALSLIFAFAAVAMANTLYPNSSTTGDGINDYASPANPNLGTGYTAGTTRIHSNYQENTNACAACHAIHTAVGPMLLQWKDDQATCDACHNGSLGDETYNVYAGTIGGNGGMQTWGGAFSSTAPSASMHNVGTSVAIGAAPGGFDGLATGDTAKWGADFTCTSCHDPHGTGGNGRILNPKVNGANYQAKTQQALYNIGGNTYVARLPITYGDYAEKNNNPGEYGKLLGGHGNDLTVYVGGVAVTEGVEYTVDNSGDFTKIVFAETPASAPTATFTAALRVKMMVDNYLKSTEKVTYIKGMNDFCGACHTDYNTSTAGRKQATIKPDGVTSVALFDQGMPYYVKSTSTYKVLTGSYHDAYRHAVGRFSGNDSQIAQGLQFEQIKLQDSAGNNYNQFVFVCTTCHVAHGANETVWQNFKNEQDASGNNLKGITNPGEKFDGPDLANTGSRLKRMPNMATCETCHEKAANNAGMPY